jgi:SAM-dependent methyltransferase
VERVSDTEYTGIDNLDVLVDAVRYNRFLVDEVLRACAGCAAALDFGAGTGTLSVLVRERGMTVACVEADARLRERLSQQGFEVFDDIARVPVQSQEFIYSINVLEHIEHDEAALKALHARLKPGGHCMLYVPALQLLYSSMDRKIGHYRRYHRGGLVAMAGRAGFTVERVGYADSLGFFVTLLYKMIGSRRGDISPSSVRIYDRFIFPLSRAMDRVGCSHLFGKNLLIVLRRPHGATA